MNRGAPPEKEEAPRVQSRSQKSKNFTQSVSVQPESRKLVRSQFGVSLFEIRTPEIQRQSPPARNIPPLKRLPGADLDATAGVNVKRGIA